MSLTEQIYAKLPIFAQNWAVNYQGWSFERKRSRPDLIEKHLAFLLESQWWTEEQFREYQVRRLQETLKIAFETTDYGRELQASLGCQPEDFKAPEDVRRLPILEKSRLRGHEKEFVNHTADLTQCTQVKTSGTTGTPLKAYENADSFAARLAYVARLRTWAEVPNPVHPHRAQFTGRTIVPDSQPPFQPPHWRANRPNDALLFSTVHIGEKTIRGYAEALCRFEPTLIDGYPSAILMVARLAKLQGLTLPRPKAIIVSAETLLPEHRSEIVEAFGCRVFDQYASSEPSCFWMDNEHGEMLQSPEYGISEIIKSDGSPAEPGEEGEVVVTSFLNSVMPLLRYRVGDVAVPGVPGAASCGRKMPRVLSISGRRDDILYVPERGYVGRLDPVFKGLSNMVETQIVQESLDSIVILLVPAPEYKAADGEQLVRNLREKVGHQVAVELKVVEMIPRGPNGKFRSVVSHCQKEYPVSAQ